MNGPAHYAAAELLLAKVDSTVAAATPNTVDMVVEMSAIAIARAQVHATLAHSAAVVDFALDQLEPGMITARTRAWEEAVSS